MAKLVVIIGPQVVGKMTVGQELAKITDLKLFHNHMTFDLVSEFFYVGTEIGWDLLCKLRYDVLEAVANSELEGVMFTFNMNFDNQQWIDYMNSLVALFEDNGGSAYFVELETDFEERLARNKSENRLLHKPSKRDVARSEASLRGMMQNMRMNTHDGEQLHTNWLKIMNTNVSAAEAAVMIKDKFGL